MAETLAALARRPRASACCTATSSPATSSCKQDGHTKITDFGIAKSFDIRAGSASPDRRHDDDGSRPGHAGLPGSGATIGPSGHRAVRPVRGRRRHGGGPDRTTPRPRPRPGRRGCRPRCRDVAGRALADGPAGALRVGGRHARRRCGPDHWPAAPVRRDGSRTGDAGHRPFRPVAAVAAASARRHPALPSSPHRARAARGSARPGPTAPSHRGHRRRAGARPSPSSWPCWTLAPNRRGRPRPPAKHHGRTQALTRPIRQSTDTEGSAITALATSLANGGLPGDGALASALQDDGRRSRPGPARQASAQQTLSLAGVLLDGGGITPGQYQDVVERPAADGATVTTTTTTVPAPPSRSRRRSSAGHRGHGHGRGQRPGGGPGD